MSTYNHYVPGFHWPANQEIVGVRLKDKSTVHQPLVKDMISIREFAGKLQCHPFKKASWSWLDLNLCTFDWNCNEDVVRGNKDPWLYSVGCQGHENTIAQQWLFLPPTAYFYVFRKQLGLLWAMLLSHLMQRFYSNVYELLFILKKWKHSWNYWFSCWPRMHLQVKRGFILTHQQPSGSVSGWRWALCRCCSVPWPHTPGSPRGQVWYTWGRLPFSQPGCIHPKPYLGFPPYRIV